jgi:hypothetical protein
METSKITYDGFEALQISTAKAKMVLVYGSGPRIAYFGTNEDNFFYWDKDAVKNKDWRLRGGHRVWITRPMADESVDAYMADNEACDLQIEGNVITATSPPNEIFAISRGMRIEVLSDTVFKVVNFVKNEGNLIYSGGVWSPTCINPDGKKVVIPLGEDTTWDIVKIVIPRKFAGNTVLLNDPQVTFSEEAMTVVPEGIVSKRCVKAPQGKISAVWEEKSLTFTKHSAYISNGNYPNDGCNIAVFVGLDNWMVELETFGVDQPIIPGQTVFNEETWELEIG